MTITEKTMSIDIRDLTFIINLHWCKVSPYLNFMDDCKKIKKMPGGSNIESEKIANDFLVIRVPATLFQSDLLNLIACSLNNHKLNYIAIDELFPDDNSYLLAQTSCPSTASWVIEKQFTPTLSVIEVSR